MLTTMQTFALNAVLALELGTTFLLALLEFVTLFCALQEVRMTIAIQKLRVCLALLVDTYPKVVRARVLR